jgi:hypothetical protein
MKQLAKIVRVKLPPLPKQSAEDDAIAAKPELQNVTKDKVLGATAVDPAVFVSADLEVAPAIQNDVQKAGEIKADGDIVMTETSAAELPSSMVAQAPTSMDIGDDTVVNLLGQST